MPVLTLPSSDSPSVRAQALVFEDARSRALLERLTQVAPSDATILLSGETGTGKELVARHIHELSARRAGPFVSVNCGALPASIVESELFGHELPAFSGAAQNAGCFEAAHGGTLFLDEIGGIPLATQLELLRVLQDGEIVRLGAHTPQRVDVRFIAATQVDLQEAVRAGRFREDLYRRLNAAPLALLPLRERPADIVPLAQHFLEVYGQRLQRQPVPQFGPQALRALVQHAWPGNIRELENAVHHALLVASADLLEPEDLRLRAGFVPPAALDPNERREASAAPADADSHALDRVFERMFEAEHAALFEHVQQRLVLAAYRHCDRNQVHTARLLGISRNVVRARLQEAGELGGGRRKPPRAGPTQSRAAQPTAAGAQPSSGRNQPLASIG